MPLTRLRQILGQLSPDEEMFRTPDYNPESLVPYGQEDLWSDEPTETAEPQGRAMVDAVTQSVRGTLPDDRTESIRSLQREYLEQIAREPEQKGWRTAAAIGTAFLRPLREAGIPKMLATSPEQREWAAKNSLLSKRMDDEYKLAEEAYKQRGAGGVALSHDLAGMLKPNDVAGAYGDPWSGQHAQVLKPGEQLAIMGSGGKEIGGPKQRVYNPAILTAKPGEVTTKGEETLAGPPTSIDGTLTGYGREPTVAPGQQSKSDALLGVEKETGEWQKLKAQIDAASAQGVASKNLAGEQYKADKGVEEAKIRGPYRASAVTPDIRRSAASAATRFGDHAKKLYDSFLNPKIGVPSGPEELRDAVSRLEMLYNSQASALQALDPSLDLYVDFSSVVAPAIDKDEGEWFQFGDSVIKAQVLPAFQRSIQQAQTKLSTAAQQIAANQPAESQPPQQSTGAPGSYTEKDVMQRAAENLGMTLEEYEKLIEE